MIEMAAASAMNSIDDINKNDFVSKNVQENIKEEDVIVKPEPHECAVCVSRSVESVEIYDVKTSCGTSLVNFLCKYAHSNLVASSSKHICKRCYDLIDVLEQTELEYLKLKESFEAIISKNPLFDNSSQELGPVKFEAPEDYVEHRDDDSDDEPLAIAKKRRPRKTVTRKKSVQSTAKRKNKTSKYSWNVSVESAADNHEHALLPDVKQEDSQDGSETSQFNNGIDFGLKLEMDVDDDESPNYMPDERSNSPRRPVGRPRKSEVEKKKKPKIIHECDQCNAKYTSIRRLEAHMEKHSDGKPPYICEVCGAHYKHKRACDIHVALHKGISDWKCEECNKLFPSKGALQRHNNIHTGKLNYQCDLCGKSFIHTSSFKMHKLSHSGVKPHSCDVCGLALMTRSHLKRHKRVHSGEKRHECAVCGKRFSERYNLLAHSKMHEMSQEEVAAAQVPPRRRLFRCTFCVERFERRYMLERHMSAEHGRTLERVPATPRNTMSKLLKAQAQARVAAAPPPAPPPPPPAHAQPLSADGEVPVTKVERSPDSRASSILAQKLQQASASASATITASSWSNAYAAEFGIRHDFPH